MHYSLPKTGALGHPSSLMSPLVTADNHIAPHQQSTRETAANCWVSCYLCGLCDKDFLKKIGASCKHETPLDKLLISPPLTTSSSLRNHQNNPQHTTRQQATQMSPQGNTIHKQGIAHIHCDKNQRCCEIPTNRYDIATKIAISPYTAPEAPTVGASGSISRTVAEAPIPLTI